MGSAAVTKEAENDYRRSGRHRVMLAAQLYSVHGEMAAVLLDLSEGGAMLSATPALPAGCKVLLVRRSLEASATVRWSDGNRFGLQFNEPLDDRLVNYLVTRPDVLSAH
jgi:hypothetical protein